MREHGVAACPRVVGKKKGQCAPPSLSQQPAILFCQPSLPATPLARCLSSSSFAWSSSLMGLGAFSFSARSFDLAILRSISLIRSSRYRISFFSYLCGQSVKVARRVVTIITGRSRPRHRHNMICPTPDCRCSSGAHNAELQS